VRELDRYHGSVSRDVPARPHEPRFAPSAQSPLALEAPLAEPKWRRKRLKRLDSDSDPEFPVTLA